MECGHVDTASNWIFLLRLLSGLAGFCQLVEKNVCFPRKKTGVAKIVFFHLNLRLLFFDKRLVLSYYIQLWFRLFSVTKFVLPTYLLTKNMYNV